MHGWQVWTPLTVASDSSCAGDVSYLVTTTHADSVLALGGSRNMRSLYRRECSMFKSNKVSACEGSAWDITDGHGVQRV